MTELLKNDDNTAEIVSRLRALAKAIEDGVQPGGLISRANDWHGNTKASNTDPNDGRNAFDVQETEDGDPDIPPPEGDPAGELAIARPDWTTKIAGELAAAVLWIDRSVTTVTAKIAKIDTPTPPPKKNTSQTAQQAIDAFADANIGRGQCDVCRDSCSGARNDRLSLMTVQHTVWHAGQETKSDPESRLVCKACRDAWRRHTATYGTDGFLEWERQRQLGRERETA